jgi:hypothetical protein
MTLMQSPLSDDSGQTYGEFVAQSLQSAEKIIDRTTAPSDFYRIGPMAVTVRTAGAALRRLLSPALAHAKSEAIATKERGWTIYAVDGHATGEPPPAEWTLPIKSFDNQLRVHADKDGRVLAADPDRGLWSMADIPTKQGLYWVRDANALPDWEPGGPYRLLLHVAAQAEGLQLVHAAAVETAGRGILLAGPGGSGKSTTTLALIMNGAATAGEDFIMLEPGTPPVAHALYDTLKLTGMATALYPEVMTAAVNPLRPVSEKARIHLSEVMPTQLRPAMELHAVMSLRLGHGARTRIHFCGPMAAMRALSPSSAFLLRVNRNETLARVSALARSLPAFEVELSGDPIEAAQAITAFASEIPT